MSSDTIITDEQVTEILEYAEWITEKRRRNRLGVSSYRVYLATLEMVNRRGWLRGISAGQVRDIVCSPDEYRIREIDLHL